MNANVNETKLEQLLSPEQVAILFGISVKTLSKWRSVGRGPNFIKIGRLPRYKKEDLICYINRKNE